MRHKGLGYAQGHLPFKLQGVFPLLSPSQVCPVPTFSLDTSCIRAISIDLDDTLWPIWPTIAKGEQVLLNWLTLHVDADRKLSLLDRIAEFDRLDPKSTVFRYPDGAHSSYKAGAAPDPETWVDFRRLQRAAHKMFQGFERIRLHLLDSDLHRRSVRP